MLVQGLSFTGRIRKGLPVQQTSTVQQSMRTSWNENLGGETRLRL